MKKLLLVLIGIVLTTYAFADPSVFNTINSGRKTVSSAGTSEQLSASNIACSKIVITAETDNTGIIVVGGSNVVASLSTRVGTPLSAGASVTVLVNSLSKIYLDTTVNGDGVTYTYYQ